MDLSPIIMDLRSRKMTKFTVNDDFRKLVNTPSMFAAGYGSRMISSRPFNVERKNKFVSDHHLAWSSLITNLSNWEQSSAELKLPRRDHLLIAAWHFPELPTLFNYVIKSNALVLVSQDAPWLEKLRQSGCSLNMSLPESGSKLSNEMEKGRIIGCIFDHYHPRMQSVTTKFFGRTIHTNSGILELCSKYKYTILFVAPRNSKIEIVGQIDATDRTPVELAQQYCTWLESEVNKNPENWLMWQNLPAATIEIPIQLRERYKKGRGK